MTSTGASVFRPGPDSRGAAVRQIRTGIVASIAASERSRDQMMRDLSAEIAQPQANSISIGAGGAWVFFDSMNLAVAAAIQGRDQAEDLMQKAFSEAYWGFEILRHGWGGDYTLPTRVMDKMLAFCGLCFAGGHEKLGDWISDFALRSIKGIGDYEIRESDVLDFHRLALTARLSGAWPEKPHIRRSLGEFRELLILVDEPNGFEAALLAYVDLRLSRAFRYADRTSLLAKRPSEAPSYFENLWFALIPTELFLFGAAAEKCRGFKPALDAACAVLSVDLKPPAFDLRDSDFSSALRGYGLRTFGSRWRPVLSGGG